MLQKQLDRELDTSFEVMMKLKTQSAFSNPSRLISNVFITLEDVNDNSPEFVYDSRHDEKSYLVTISETTSPGTGIIQIKVTDADSGAFGEVQFSIKAEDGGDYSDLFAIDGKSGVVRTTGSIVKGDGSQLPYRLLVTAYDNAGDSYNSNSQTTELFVNIIGAQDGIVLVIDDTPVEEMELKRAKLQMILEEQTDFIVSIDHLVPSMVRYVLLSFISFFCHSLQTINLFRYANDTCCKINKDGTDVYFHVIDPKTGKVLPYDHPDVRQ